MTGHAFTVFITGASGYLGRYVVRAILDLVPEATLRCLVRASALAPAPAREPGRVEIVFGHLGSDERTLAALVAGCDSVVHLAGYGLGAGETDWGEAFDVNVGGTFRLALAAREAGAKRFIMARTALECGPSGAAPVPGNPPRLAVQCLPEGPYAATKFAGAELARAACAEAQMTFVGLRVFNTFGPGEPAHKLVPANILASLEGKPLPMTSGVAVRDYVFAGDVGRAFALALARRDLVGRHTLDIGTGRGVTTAEMARRVCAMIPGAPGPALGVLPDRPGEPPVLVADPADARRLLGWEPKWDLDAALRETIEWYRAAQPGNRTTS